MLVLAVAGGAWALFGRDDKKSPTAIGPKVPTAAPGAPVFGPVSPGKAVKPAATVTPTSLGPVAATASTKPAATQAPSAAPTKAAAKPTPTPTVAATKAPVAKPAATAPPTTKPSVVTPPVTGPQQAGTVAKKAYTFKVARGDTLWNLTKQTLSTTGRSTSNANVAAYVDKLYAQNRGVIGSDPNLIVPGQVITWPSGL